MLLLSQKGDVHMSFSMISWMIFGVAVLLWAVILAVFVVIKIRNSFQRKKYSVKQSGDVSTQYESRGLQ